MNRRVKTILLPLAVASMAAGCTTFSDAVARVDDVELSESDLETRLIDAGATQEQLDRSVPAEAVRASISEWIVETAGGVSNDDVAARFNEGIETAGISCPAVMATPDLESAQAAADRIASGESFDTVFAEVNTNPNLAAGAGRVGCFTLDQITPDDRESPDVQALFELSSETPARGVEVGDATFAEGFVVAFQGLDELVAEEADAVSDFVRNNLAGEIDLSDFDIHVDSRYGTFNAETGTISVLG